MCTWHSIKIKPILTLVHKANTYLTPKLTDTSMTTTASEGMVSFALEYGLGLCKGKDWLTYIEYLVHNSFLD